MIVLVLLCCSPRVHAAAPQPATYEPPPPSVSPRLKVPVGNARAVTISPDGKSLFTLSTDKPPLQIWDLSTGRSVKSIAKAPDAEMLAASADGRTLAILGRYDGIVSLMDLETAAIHELPEPHNVKTMAFDRGGAVLVTAHFDGVVRLWDAKTLAIATTLKGKGEPRAVDLSPDGRFLAVLTDTSFDPTYVPVMNLWDVKAAKLIASVEGFAEGNGSIGKGPGVRFSPDGKTIVFRRQPSTFAVWDMAAGKFVRQYDSPRRGYYGAVSPAADRTIAVPEARPLALHVADAATGRTICTLAGLDMNGVPECSADGQTVVTAGFEKVLVWSIPAPAKPAATRPAEVPPASQRMVGIWESRWDSDPDKTRDMMKADGVPPAMLRQKVSDLWARLWSMGSTYQFFADGSATLAQGNQPLMRGTWEVVQDNGRIVRMRMVWNDIPVLMDFIAEGNGWMRVDMAAFLFTNLKPRLFLQYVEPSVPGNYAILKVTRIDAIKAATALLRTVNSEATAKAAAEKLPEIFDRYKLLEDRESNRLPESRTGVALSALHDNELSDTMEALAEAVIAIRLHPERLKPLDNVLGPSSPVYQLAQQDLTAVDSAELLAAFKADPEAAKKKYLSRPLAMTAVFQSYEPATRYNRPAFLVTLIPEGKPASDLPQLKCEVPGTLTLVKELRPGTRVRLVGVLLPDESSATQVKFFQGLYLRAE
jgi:hypothetical protein